MRSGIVSARRGIRPRTTSECWRSWPARPPRRGACHASTRFWTASLAGTPRPAGPAVAGRALPGYHAFLDSVVSGNAAGPNALRYWGAVGLQLGASPDSVAARLVASIDADTDVATLNEFVGLLEANSAVN